MILATPSKIGNPGGRVFDIMSVDSLSRAPIYLVTTEPQTGNSADNERFAAAGRALRSPKMQSRLRERGVEFHWVVVDGAARATSLAKEHLVFPGP